MWLVIHYGYTLHPISTLCQQQLWGNNKYLAMPSIPLPHCLFHILNYCTQFVSAAYPRIARASTCHVFSDRFCIVRTLVSATPHLDFVPHLGIHSPLHQPCIFLTFRPHKTVTLKAQSRYTVTLTTQRFPLSPLCVIHYLPW